MSFQLNSGIFQQGAAQQSNNRSQLFDSISRGLAMGQRMKEMDMRERQYKAKQEAQANAPKNLADAGMMKAAQGLPMTPQEQAAMKVWQAKQRPVFDHTTQRMLGAPDIFKALNIGGSAPSAPQQAPSSSVFDVIMPQAGGSDNFNQFIPDGVKNNPKAKQVAIEETIKQNIRTKADQEKEQRKEQKNWQAREAFDDTLEEVLADLELLHEQNGTISKDHSLATNVGSVLANAPLVGAGTQLVFDPETQGVRNRIEGKRPVLFNQIKKSTGLTGGELNSQFEVENQLKQLGNDYMTYEARRDLLRGLSTNFGTGRLSEPKDKKNSKHEDSKSQSNQGYRFKGRSYTQEQIESTARKRGMSVEEVLEKLKGL